MTELEKAWALSAPTTAKLQRPLAAYSARRLLLLDTSTPGWTVLLGSSAAAQALGTLSLYLP